MQPCKVTVAAFACTEIKLPIASTCLFKCLVEISSSCSVHVCPSCYATLTDCKLSKIQFRADYQNAVHEDFQRRLQGEGGFKGISEFTLAFKTVTRPELCLLYRCQLS